MQSPIAVVSAGCVLPGARSVDEFWSGARAGRSFVRPPRYDRAGTGAGDSTPKGRAGGYVADEFRPDAARPGAGAEELAEVNPMQWVALEAGAQAAGGVRALPRASTAVLVGSSGLGFRKDSGLRVRFEEWRAAVESAPGFAALEPARRAAVLSAVERDLDARLRQSSADPVIGSLASVAAARLAARFDLRGAHYAVDADHASALAALELAALGLREGEWDCALVGGVSELLGPLDFLAYSGLGWVSELGPGAPWDPRSPGCAPGEGAVFFALKRLDDAERDGERVLAVLSGMGSCAAGSREENVASAARAAWSAAGVTAADVHGVECDAPGVPAADAAEARGLARACEGGGESGRGGEAMPVASGAAGVGHARAAAGAVSLLRAVLAVARGELLPVARGTGRAGDGLPRGLRAVVRAEGWPRLAPGGVRRAGVSAVSLGGQAFHAVLESPGARASVATQSPRRAEPLAVVAMAGVYPGADGVEAFWQGLLAGRDAVREVPASRWDLERFGTSDPKRRERTYARRGSFLEALPAGDGGMDASHALAARLARAARGAAGGDPERVRAYVGFMPFFAQRFRAEARAHYGEFDDALAGALTACEAGEAVSGSVRAQAARAYLSPLPTLGERSLPGWLASGMADAVAREFGAAGARAGVESACASTLAALHAASLALAQRAADAVVVAAAFCDLSPEFYVACSRFRALSPEGIRPFGADPRGFVPGEGAGLFVLKRLDDARRDGDPVLAVVRAVAGSSDGAAGGGSVLRPAVAGEALAIERALSRAGVSPAEVGYVECHGAGTAVGDAAEIAALGATYGRMERARPLWVGSVKSNLGHLCAAAGAPALTKTVLALSRGVIPPTLHCEPANPAIDFAAAGVATTPHVVPWPGERGPRRAGVSAFGLGGTNFHAILEQADP